ncbi:hypothetical protein [Burkholderia multivorans]|uniref:hypothetical protein n=1 Tax=Burkholderia multivorans TaxID=87883 RepID=UPI001C2176E8|nr:hypothetical protein [Burkholderia multivorans]MBU9470444.1 hypothetical protein [Burkholderia multivorans]
MTTAQNASRSQTALRWKTGFAPDVGAGISAVAFVVVRMVANVPVEWADREHATCLVRGNAARACGRSRAGSGRSARRIRPSRIVSDRMPKKTPAASLCGRDESTFSWHEDGAFAV